MYKKCEACLVKYSICKLNIYIYIFVFFIVQYIQDQKYHDSGVFLDKETGGIHQF